MNDRFYKFPTTPHLLTTANSTVREDKVLSQKERDDLLQHELLVEEKMDGANLGISFDSLGKLRVQNRGEYLSVPYLGQWKALPGWLAFKSDSLFDHLNDQFILFGEWCYAQHSTFYDRLPDWFLGFDILDKNSLKFLSWARRHELCSSMAISEVPFIKKGYFTLSELEALLANSCFGDKPAEGIYLRVDDGEWTKQRAKLVRQEFIQIIEKHWSQKPITPNKLEEAPCSLVTETSGAN